MVVTVRVAVVKIFNGRVIAESEVDFIRVHGWTHLMVCLVKGNKIKVVVIARHGVIEDRFVNLKANNRQVLRVLVFMVKPALSEIDKVQDGVGVGIVPIIVYYKEVIQGEHDIIIIDHANLIVREDFFNAPERV